jgi:hypothetical protein
MTDEFGPCETILVAVLRTVSIDSMNPIVADWSNPPRHFVLWKRVGSQQSRWTLVPKAVRSIEEFNKPRLMKATMTVT